MSKVVNIAEVQRALDRAARNAQAGPPEARAGQVRVDPGKAGGHSATRRDDPAPRDRRRGAPPVRPRGHR
jgi:hypothetical protein